MEHIADQKIEERFHAVARSGTFRNVVRHFRLHERTVLDIGCSSGEHLVHFGPHSVGVTIVGEEAEYGKRRGLDVREGNIESPDFRLENTFDVMFCNNLFEHLLSPHGFLIRIKEFLKPDGILVLGVPCIPWLTPMVRMQKFRGSMASNHINFFTRSTLRRTVERAGWNLEVIRGFHFVNPAIDHLLDPVYPHFYLGATMIPDFQYPHKRQNELAGYDDVALTG